MKTKKCGVIAALAAVLLITAALVTTCTESFTPSDLTVSQKEDPVRFVPPEGMGYIRLNLGVESFTKSARTAKPTSTTYTTLSSFAAIQVTFVATTDNATNGKTVAWDGIANIPLNPDEYAITVIGYNSTTIAPANAVGLGSVTGVTVDPGEGANTTITIKEIVDGTGTGNFSWTFTNTFGVDEALLNFTNLGGGAENTYVAYDADLVSGSPKGLVGNIDLDSGYYRMTLDVSKSGHASVKISEIIHIWNGHNTVYPSRALTLKPNQHTVTYNYQDERTTTAPYKVFTHGTPLTHPTGVTTPQFLENDDTTVRPISFVGWFTKDGDTVPGDWGNQWIVNAVTPANSTPVIRTLDLFAKWGGFIVNIGYNTTSTAFTYTFEEDDGAGGWDTITFAGYEIDQDDPKDVRITISNGAALVTAGATGFNLLNEQGTIIDTVSSTPPYTLIIDFSDNVSYLLKGSTFFTVETIGTFLSDEITFTIVEPTP